MKQKANQFTIKSRYSYYEEDKIYSYDKFQVYKGFDNIQNTTVSIKIIDLNSQAIDIIQFDDSPFNIKSNIDSKQNFLNKQLQRYNAQKNSNCPYIMQIFDIIEEQQRLIIIGEWFNNGSFKIYLDKVGYLDEQDAIFVFKQIVQGLKEIHDKGIVHGYLQLQNILISPQNLKISDYAEIIKDEYLPPEALTGQMLVNKSSGDIWMLGIILYKLVYGIFPYNGEKELIINKINAKEKDQPNQGNSIFKFQISKECNFLIQRLLEKNADQRPNVDEILRNSLLEQIKFDVPKKQYSQTINLPEQLKDKYILFRSSKQKQDYEGYIAEDIYFGLSITMQIPVKIKVIEYSPDSVYKYIERIKQFQSLFNKTGNQSAMLFLTVQSVEIDKGFAYVIQDYNNQGNLNDYLIKKKNITATKFLSEGEVEQIIQIVSNAMLILENQMNYHGSVHIKNIWIHKGELKIGEPLILNDKAERKMKDNKNTLDHFAPEVKSNPLMLLMPKIAAEQSNSNTKSQDLASKVDLWSLGMVFYKLLFGELPIFDLNQIPIFPKQPIISLKLRNLVSKCLEKNQSQRITWNQILRKDDQLFTNSNEKPNNLNNQIEDAFLPMKNPLKTNPSQQNQQISIIMPSNNDNSGINFTQQPVSIDQSMDANKNYFLKARQQNGIDDSPIKLSKDDSQLGLAIDDSNATNQQEEALNKQEEDYAKLRPCTQQVQPQERPPDLDLIPIKQVGGERVRKVKVFIKCSLIILALMLIWFRVFFSNSVTLFVKRAYIKTVSFTQKSSDGTQITDFTLLTEDPEYFINNFNNINEIKNANIYCFQNIFDPQNHPNRQLIDYFKSQQFFWWDFCSILVMIVILLIKIMQIINADFFTIIFNYREQKFVPYNRFLIILMVLNHFEFSFLYYAHYQFFNLFYYINYSPCIGVDRAGSNQVPMIFDSTTYLFNGETGQFLQYIFFSMGLFGILHFLGSIYYIYSPLRNSQIFLNPLHIIFRLFSFLFGIWIVCRIGALLIFSPTFSIDQSGIISAIYEEGQFQGVMGFFPELMELILWGIDVSVEYISDKLATKITEHQKKTSIQINPNKRKRDFLNELNKASEMVSRK